MKYCFFVNPVAGTGKEADKLVDDIHNLMVEMGQEFNYKVVITKGNDDGIIRAHALARDLNGEQAKFFVAGGDGSINEVLNGVFGYDNISIGVIPIGTGNDAVRNFTEAGDFLSLEQQVRGSTKKIDILKYSGKIDGREQTSYCINMFNIGFDCNVVELTLRLKQKPLLSGSLAYLMAVAGMVIKKKGTSLTIKEDGKIIREGDMLLCAVSNGSYCGGGIKSAPLAVMDDGEFDVNIINDVSRFTFARLFPAFRRGEHAGDMPGIENIIEMRRMKSIELLPYGSEDLTICVDGEIQHTKGIKIEICPQALSFIVPQE